MRKSRTKGMVMRKSCATGLVMRKSQPLLLITLYFFTDPEANPEATAATGLERATRRASPGALAPHRVNLEHRV